MLLLFLQVCDISAIETKTEFEGQQKLVNELEKRLADAEYKLIEGEKLRKELHNTILVTPLAKICL
jgi:kinesin family protein C1